MIIVYIILWQLPIEDYGIKCMLNNLNKLCVQLLAQLVLVFDKQQDEHRKRQA